MSPDDELAVSVADPALAATLTRAFEDDLERSKTWTAEEWRRRPFSDKILERFGPLFGEMF